MTTAQLIDGNALSKQLREDVAARTAALKARDITPGLAVVLVGENPASQVYAVSYTHLTLPTNREV